MSRQKKGDRPRTLEPDASAATLIRSAALNHRHWFTAQAVHGGGEVRRTRGVSLMITPNEITIPFPSLPSATADAALDAVVADCRAVKPNIVGVWASTPTRPRDLGARLLARGFSIGWQPHWMAMDFRKLPLSRSNPPGIEVAVEEECDWEIFNLPYYSRAGEAAFRALASSRPQPAYHFAARIDGRIAGHSVIYLTRGAFGVAGIYNVGVLPGFRRKGVGTALMLESCEFARGLGYHYALLNSAASDFYSAIGFDSLGWGQTWWMHKKEIDGPPASPGLANFISALSRGDIRALDRIAPADLPQDFDAPLSNGMTPMEVATQSSKPASADWLIARGAALDVRDAWDLGWKERIPALVAQSPDLIDRRRGDRGSTLLHEAILRGDVEFVRTLLTFKPNLEIKDSAYHSTPLGWARFFGKHEIVALIEAHAKANA